MDVDDKIADVGSSRRAVASSVNVGFPHKDLFAKPALNDGASSTSPTIQPRGVDKEGSIASAVTGWRPEAAVLECRASGDVGVDRLRRSLLPLFSAPAWRSQLEFLTQCIAGPHRAGGERNAQDGRSLPSLARCIECGSDKGTEVRAYPAAPPGTATRATPTQTPHCRNLRAQTLVSHRVPPCHQRCNDGRRGKCALGWSGGDGKLK